MVDLQETGSPERRYEHLLGLKTEDLFEKFGVGGHKPGSGSAAALVGMLASKLIQTVIKLTTDSKHRLKYAEWLSTLEKIDADISSRIYPRLKELFQKDSEQFDKVIRLRITRDEETNDGEKQLLKERLQIQLKLSTEIPLEIAKLCCELSHYSVSVFDHGYQSARGDSNVALFTSASAINGCLSVVDLNLLSLRWDNWKEAICLQRNQIAEDLDNISLMAVARYESLKEEMEANKSMQENLEQLRSELPTNGIMSHAQIEQFVKGIQNLIWKHRSILWKNDTSITPKQILLPDIIFKKVMQYEYKEVRTLGQDLVLGQVYDLAGITNTATKTVTISKLFSREVQNFTAAHELGHALLHTDTILHRDRALDGSSPSNVRDQKEIQADKFAAFFLMPEKQVVSSFQRIFQTNRLNIDAQTVVWLNQGTVGSFRAKCKDLRGFSRVIAEAEFFKGNSFNSLSKEYRVSVEAMAIRLEELRLLEF